MLKMLISRGMSRKEVTYLRGTGGKRRRTSLINARAGPCALGSSERCLEIINLQYLNWRIVSLVTSLSRQATEKISFLSLSAMSGWRAIA